MALGFNHRTSRVPRVSAASACNATSASLGFTPACAATSPTVTCSSCERAIDTGHERQVTYITAPQKDCDRAQKRTL